MELDFSREWRIIGPKAARGPGIDGGPGAFAAQELSSIIGRMRGLGPEGAPLPGDEGDTERIIVLDAGEGGDPRGRFSWRASEDRVEIYGSDGAALLRAAYDFLGALGARWVGPGPEGERLPHGDVLELSASSRSSGEGGLDATLILGHGAFLERWEEYLPWAARLGYSSVFIHTTGEALAMGAAPESLYESVRAELAPLARRLGLALELGGHGLSSLLPRSLFKEEPGLFREKDGARVPDRNLCPSSEKALSIVSEALSARALAHPEISVFHAWPDDLPGGGWCSCPSCSSLSPSAQSLKVARAMAGALARVRPEAALAFLAYHDTEDTASVLEADGRRPLPPNLELLWAPRLRSWGAALGDAGDALNAASLAAFRGAARAWREAGGGAVAVFEYWEDALLFKGAVPPLSAVLEGDLAAYRGTPGGAADRVGILCTGGRLPLGPRPNLALLPLLASDPEAGAAGALADWAGAAYGPAAGPMRSYWRELEAAWAIELDLEEGETGVHMPDSLARYASDPPADWGDPWKAGLERLERKRGRCEELFDHLRLAEAKLSEAQASVAALEAQASVAALEAQASVAALEAQASVAALEAQASVAVSEADSKEARAVRGEASEYAISGALLELDCARLSAYHELAAGQGRAAADIANIALSASAAVRKALSRLPDPRARRETAFLVGIFYDLRLRAIRRANARSGLRRLVDLWFTGTRTLLASLPLRRAYEPRALAPAIRRR